MNLPRLTGIDIGEAPRRRTSTAIVALVLLAAALSACRSGWDEPVPGCPHCGDPVTRTDAAGVPYVVPRMRLAEPSPAAAWAVLGLEPWALARSSAR